MIAWRSARPGPGPRHPEALVVPYGSEPQRELAPAHSAQTPTGSAPAPGQPGPLPHSGVGLEVGAVCHIGQVCWWGSCLPTALPERMPLNTGASLAEGRPGSLQRTLPMRPGDRAAVAGAKAPLPPWAALCWTEWYPELTAGEARGLGLGAGRAPGFPQEKLNFFGEMVNGIFF